MADFDTLLAHEPGWAWLKARGWQIVPVTFPVGTARCNQFAKRIEMKPAEWRKPSRRTLRYVLPHEIAHGVHWEQDNYRCGDLLTDRNLAWLAGVEVVAERWCIERDTSASMRRTVQQSCLWHGRVGRSRYRFADVMSDSARSIVNTLQVEADRG